MKVAITQETSLPQEKSAIINRLSDAFEEFFNKKSYGLGVEEIYIGVITVKPEFDFFFKTRKPKYDRKANSLSFDVKMDFNTVDSANVNEIPSLVVSQIIEALTAISKIPDFEKDHFEKDLNSFINDSPGLQAISLN